jgi:hypothetical protein
VITQNASPAFSPCLQQFQDSVSLVAGVPFDPFDDPGMKALSSNNTNQRDANSADAVCL